MTTDCSIYVAKFSDGWRVICAKAIENIYQSREDLYLYFHHAPLFKSKKQAFECANRLFWSLTREKPTAVEWGITDLGYLGELSGKIRKHRRSTKTYKKK